MKKVLQSGRVINQAKIEHQMMEEGNFELNKKKHADLQAQKRIMLEKAEMQMRHSITNREAIQRRVRAVKDGPHSDRLPQEEARARAEK